MKKKQKHLRNRLNYIAIITLPFLHFVMANYILIGTNRGFTNPIFAAFVYIFFLIKNFNEAKEQEITQTIEQAQRISTMATIVAFLMIALNFFRLSIVVINWIYPVTVTILGVFLYIETATISGLVVGALRKRYGLHHKNDMNSKYPDDNYANDREKLNPRNVPEYLRQLIPYAQQLTLENTLSDDDILSYMSSEEIQTFIDAVSGKNYGRLLKWLQVCEAEGLNHSKEYAAFKRLQEVYEIAWQQLNNRGVSIQRNESMKNY